MSPPMRTVRPDFRSIYKNLNAYDREQATIRMDSSYDVITNKVDLWSLNETDTALLVEKYTLTASVHQAQKCFEVIMGTIWPSTAKPTYIVINNAITDPASAPNPMVENALGVQTTGDVKTCKVFQVTDSKFTMAMDDDRLIIEKEGRAVSLLGRLRSQLPIAQSGASHQNPTTGNPESDATIDIETANNASQTPPTSDSPSSDATINSEITNNATQTPPSGGPSTSGVPGSGPSSQPPSSSSSAPTPSHAFTRNIGYFPMPSGRDLKRTHAFTEWSLPDAQTIVLGPLPPPTLPSHVQTSTLPPGHPPQSYGPGAFPPFYNIPGASSGLSNSGATSGIAEEVASASSTQPVVSVQSPVSSDNSNKRSRDDEDDEEESTRPTARLYIEAPPQSDDTTAHAGPSGPALTLSPSGNGEGSSNSGSPKKRSRDAEEDDEENARPTTRTRQESPAVSSRYPSPTPSDRRTGRIIAPFGTSIRLSPPSPSASLSSPKIKEQIAKEASKE